MHFEVSPLLISMRGEKYCLVLNKLMYVLRVGSASCIVLIHANVKQSISAAEHFL